MLEVLAILALVVVGTLVVERLADRYEKRYILSEQSDEERVRDWIYGGRR